VPAEDLLDAGRRQLLHQGAVGLPHLNMTGQCHYLNYCNYYYSYFYYYCHYFYAYEPVDIMSVNIIH
jgi:hypothetical protein